jgi:hypothetical protein
MPKKIFHYSPTDGRYLELPIDAAQELGFAQESPLEPNVYLIPAFATDIAPPPLVTDKWPVFKGGKWIQVDYVTSKSIFSIDDGHPIEPVFGLSLDAMRATDKAPPAARPFEAALYVNGDWKIKPDWRGVDLFDTKTGLKTHISEVGQLPSDIGATDAPPPSAIHSWINGGWKIDPAKIAEQLVAVKKAAMDRIDAYGKAQRVKIAGTPDEIEIAAWNNKLVIAKAIKAGTASAGDKAAFQAEINARGKGETIDSFTDKVLTNAAFYAQAVGLIDGLKRHTQDAVNAADTPEAIEAVLAGMKAQAEAAFAQLMKAVP